MRHRPAGRTVSVPVARAVRVFGALLMSGSCLAIVSPAATADAATECNVQPGAAYNDDPWQQTRLNFRSAWGVSRGAGVTVAVLDSGLDANLPTSGQVHIQMHTAPGYNVIPAMKGQAKPTGTLDCFKHGTEVAAIIGATRTDSAFLGVAPDATILPIKITDGSSQGSISQATFSTAIRTAVNAGAQVINMSNAADGAASNMGQLRKAVEYAGSKGVVIVAAAGNDGATSNLPAFPAAFSTTEKNVIAVSATDENDVVGKFSEHGDYVTLAAPGVDVWVASANGYIKETGTSYATPYVSGTVALMLAAHPELRGHPELIRNRLIATADPPPVKVPDQYYGYGIVDPYLAVTSIRDDAAVASTAPSRTAVGQPLVATQPDRRLQHIALAVGLSLLGLAVLAAVGTTVYRAADRNRTGGARAST